MKSSQSKSTKSPFLLMMTNESSCRTKYKLLLTAFRDEDMGLKGRQRGPEKFKGGLTGGEGGTHRGGLWSKENVAGWDMRGNWLGKKEAEGGTRKDPTKLGILKNVLQCPKPLYSHNSFIQRANNGSWLS